MAEWTRVSGLPWQRRSILKVQAARLSPSSLQRLGGNDMKKEFKFVMVHLISERELNLLDQQVNQLRMA